MRICIAFTLLLLSCHINKQPSQSTKALSYLALGDSYTIGESVEETERWPVQLAQKLKNDGITIENPQIIATTGWTTDELLEGIEDANINDRTYDLVSLLIGVNNQYRGWSIETFEKEFRLLLTKAIEFAGGNTERVFIVSIPDYGVTPFGLRKNPSKIGKEIDEFNQLQKQICDAMGISFYNITEYSREAKSNKKLVAPDQLHPSGEMYKGWVEIFYEDVKAKLK